MRGSQDDRRAARRRVHVAAVAGYAFFLYVFSPMNLVVIGWFADFEDAISHRVHEVSIGALFTLGFVGVLGQLRRRDRASAAIQSVLCLCVAGGMIAASTGFEALVLAYLIPPVMLVALDPEWRRVVAPAFRPDVPMLVLSVVLLSTVWVVAVDNFGKAQDLVQGHESHWGAMAAFAAVTALLAFVGALRLPGWRLAVWSGVGATVTYAVVSLAFRFDASSLGLGGAISALLWAAAFSVSAAVADRRDGDGALVRPLDRALIAGVAVAIADRTGWRPAWVRMAFAIPVLGTAAYAVLWIALPSDRPGRRRRFPVWPLLVIGAGVVVAGGPVAFTVVPMLVVATMIDVVLLRPLRTEGRSWRGVVQRLGAGVVFSVGALVLAGVWVFPLFSAPVVPHRIDGVSTAYCTACHTNPGVARGAPIIDRIEHAGAEACVSCHDHLPVAGSVAVPDDLWRLPLSAGASP